MASTYSSLKIELIGTGDQAGTWGNTTNTNLGTAIEEAVTGSANVTFASANVAIALADTNAAQTARNLRLNLVGTIANVQTLFVPAIEKQYLVTNGLSNSVIISNGSNASPTGTTVTVPTGKSVVIFNDATNIAETTNYINNLSIGTLTINGGTANALTLTNVTISSGSITSNAATFTNVSITSGNINSVTSNASTFSNVSIVSGNINSVTSNASTFSNVTVNGGTSNGLTSTNVTIISGSANGITVSNSTLVSSQFNAYTEGITTGYVNTGSALTLNIANSTIITANLSATCTFTMPSNTAGKSFILFLKTGAGTNTATFTGVKWVGNTAPTITAVANRLDILTFAADGSNWYGNYAQGYVP
jgi:hypothetical protein